MPDWQDRNPDRPELMIYVKTWSSKKLLMDRKDRKLISRTGQSSANKEESYVIHD